MIPTYQSYLSHLVSSFGNAHDVPFLVFLVKKGQSFLSEMQEMTPYFPSRSSP
jgi:hypothetical protein